MGKIIFAGILPHPPILIPEVGGGRLTEASRSLKGAQEVAERLFRHDFDTLIIISPHGKVCPTAVPVYTGQVFTGSFANFGAAKPAYSYQGDPELALAIVKDLSLAMNCTENLLDHGALVPLYFCHQAGLKQPVIPMAIACLPLSQLFKFGQALAKTINESNKQVAIIASADLSHRLTPDAPAGYSPRGKIFDEKLVKLVKAHDVEGILNFDQALAEEAGQDALWSIAILLGALAGLPLQPEVLSYEGPFGVGYMTAAYQPR